MAGRKKDLPSEENLQQIVDLQRDELRVRMAEVKTRAENLDIQKQIALQGMKYAREDSKEERGLRLWRYGFIISFVIIVVIFFSFLVFHGEGDLVRLILIEGIKILGGMIGGSGLTIAYFMRHARKNER